MINRVYHDDDTTVPDFIGATVFLSDTEPCPDFGFPDLFDMFEVYTYIVNDHRGLYSVVIGFAIPLVSWIWRRSPRPEDERKPVEPHKEVWRPP